MAATAAKQRRAMSSRGSAPSEQHDVDAPESGRQADDLERPPCCQLYHRAIEMVGKRWSGAILLVLLDGPLHFSGIKQLVPELSDRLLSERLKELEAEGIVERRVLDGAPVRVEYSLSEKGRALEPSVRALKSWANQWLELDRP